MSRFVLLPFGSAGDVFPFVWLGRLLKAAGHHVTVVTACLFEEHVRAAGLDCVPVGRPEDFERIAKDPRIWKMVHGTKLVFDHAVQAVDPYLSAIEGCGAVDGTLAPMTCFAARIAREKLQIPLITVHLQPAVFLSAHETPLLHPAISMVRRLPVQIRRKLLQLANPVDRIAGSKLRKLCAKYRVHPPRSIYAEWWNSPDGVLALFPSWLAAPQPDWPSNLLQWSFPLEDLAAEHPLSPALQEFLSAGERPVVFTPGSANVQAAQFFKVAAESVRQLECRAVFVTREPRQVPAMLPPGCMVVEYAAFSLLLPHAAAFVHHGGIGTVSQGLAAGVPQLVMYMAHDQPDNAERIERLGVGLGLAARRFTTARVTDFLDRLLHVPAFRKTAVDCANRLSQRPDPAPLVRWIEEMTAPQNHV